VPEPSASEVEMAIGKLNTNHQVLIKSQQNWLKQGGRTICSEVHKLMNSVYNKEELPEEWKESTTVPV
jgi:hypothetical protein